MLEICRTCLGLITDMNFVNLHDGKNCERIKMELSICIPEVEPDVVVNPVLCSSCVSILHASYSFLRQCLHTEQHIKGYMQSIDVNSGVYLLEMHKRTIELVCSDSESDSEKLKENDLENLSLHETNTEKVCSGDTNRNANSEDISINNNNANKNTSTASSSKINTASPKLKKKKSGKTETPKKRQQKSLRKKSEKVNKFTEEKKLKKSNVNMQINLSDAEWLQYYTSCLRTPIKETIERSFITSGNMDVSNDPKVHSNQSNIGNNSSIVELHDTRHILSQDTDKLLDVFENSQETPNAECCNDSERHCEEGNTSYNNQCYYEVYTVKDILDNLTDKKRSNTSKALKSKKIKKSATQTQRQVYGCIRCDYLAESEYKLNLHMKRHKSEHPFRCNVCNHAAVSSTELMHHMKLHSSEVLYTCKECSYKTGVRSSLSRHMKIHCNDRPYTCNMCPYKTSDKDCLIKHKRVHDNEKPFLCPMCDFRTTDKRALNFHVVIHTGDKPYVCDICSFRTAHKRSLQAHIKLHTGKKPFSCKYCGFRTAYCYNLTLHMKKIHQAEWQEEILSQGAVEDGKS